MTAQGPGQSARLLLDIIVVLEAEGFDYAVVGAMAAAVHGSVRASVDADAVLSATAQQLAALAVKFEALGLKTTLTRGGVDDPIAAVLLIQDQFENRVDLLAGLRGLEATAYARIIQIQLDDRPIKFIGREDFIAMKAFAGGPQDLVDARHAINAGREKLDIDLLRKIAAKFGKAAVAACEELLGE